MRTIPETLRIDRWLFYCRFYKTRVRSSAAVVGGHVQLNGERATPGSRVKPGDTIEMVRDRLPYLFRVTEIPNHRGPAQEAGNCYVEDDATVREREARSAALRQDRMLMPKTPGRPDKHTRRKLRERSRDN